MIEEQYVSLDTAKLLKEAGFNEPCRIHYTKNGGRWEGVIPTVMDDIGNHTWFPCPTQALTARWLRVVYKIHVYADFNNKGWYYLVYDITNEERLDVADSYEMNYEQSLETGLQEAIKLIKK